MKVKKWENFLSDSKLNKKVFLQIDKIVDKELEQVFGSINYELYSDFEIGADSLLFWIKETVKGQCIHYLELKYLEYIESKTPTSKKALTLFIRHAITPVKKLIEVLNYCNTMSKEIIELYTDEIEPLKKRIMKKRESAQPPKNSEIIQKKIRVIEIYLTKKHYTENRSITEVDASPEFKQAFVKWYELESNIEKYEEIRKYINERANRNHFRSESKRIRLLKLASKYNNSNSTYLSQT